MIPEETIGRLQVLNVGAGDTEFSFDPDKPEEVARSKLVIQQMLKAGYLLFVRLEDGTLKRVRRFDAKHDTYIIDDEKGVAEREDKAQAAEPQVYAGTPAKGKRKKTRAIPARRARAIGVARTSGG